MQHRCAIAGIGTTEFSTNSGRSVLSLATEASTKAIADAGLKPEDIDGVIRCDFDVVTQHDLATSLGPPNLTYWSPHGPGGSAPCSMMASAVGAILSGQATNVLVFRSMNGDVPGLPGLTIVAPPVLPGDGAWAPSPPGPIGRDTDCVLRGLVGLDHAAIAQLRDEGVVIG